MRFLISILILSLSNLALAANTPPSFDSAKWQALISEVVAKGTAMETEDGSWRTLTRIIPADTTKSHEADYLSTVGGVDSNQKYFPSIVYDSYEDWQLDQSGNWNIEQWEFTISVDGELLAIAHNKLRETKDGEVLGSDELPTAGPSDAGDLKFWGQKLSEWYSN